MVGVLLYLAFPAVISLLIFVSIKMKLRAGISDSYYGRVSGQEYLNGLLVISAPAFSACMWGVYIISGGNEVFQMLSIKLSLVSMTLFVILSAITSALIVKKRNGD